MTGGTADPLRRERRRPWQPLRILFASAGQAARTCAHERVQMLAVRGRVLRVAVRDGDPALPPLLLCNGVGGSLRANPSRARELLHAATRAGSRRGYYYQLLAGASWTSLPLLPLLRHPTLVMAGDDDPIIPLINARIMHRLIPGSELHVYRGGHLDAIADPGRLAPVVQAFLTAETRPPRATKGLKT